MNAVCHHSNHTDCMVTTVLIRNFHFLFGIGFCSVGYKIAYAIPMEVKARYLSKWQVIVLWAAKPHYNHQCRNKNRKLLGFFIALSIGNTSNFDVRRVLRLPCTRSHILDGSKSVVHFYVKHIKPYKNARAQRLVFLLN